MAAAAPGRKWQQAAPPRGSMYRPQGHTAQVSEPGLQERLAKVPQKMPPPEPDSVAVIKSFFQDIRSICRYSMVMMKFLLTFSFA